MDRHDGDRKRKQRSAGSQSGSNSSDTSASKTIEVTDSKSTPKKQKVSGKKPASVKESLLKFAYKPTIEEGKDVMADKGDDYQLSDSESSNPVFSPDGNSNPIHPRDRGISNEDLMLKLCANGAEISKLTSLVDELRAALLAVQTENDKLKREVTEAKKREELMKTQLAETRHLAELADHRAEDLAAYVRRNNLRIYGLKEESGTEETSQQCEDKVVSLFNDKLKVKVKREDIEAVHRVGANQGQRRSSTQSKNPARGIIVRFVSRRVRDSVLYSRKCLKGTGTIIVEDLTPRAYSLLCNVKSDTTVCQQAWTKNGNVIMKTVSGRIVTVKSLSDFRHSDHRVMWAQRK